MGKKILLVVTFILIVISLLGLLNVFLEKKTNYISFRRGFTYFPKSLDPIGGDDVWGSFLLTQIYSRLFRVVGAGDLVPFLAKNYRKSSDNLNHDICIRSNLRFSDGSSITIDDVIWSLKRAGSPSVNKYTAHLFHRVAGFHLCQDVRGVCDHLSIRKTTPGCLRIKTITSYPTLAKVLSTPVTSILKKGTRFKGRKIDGPTSGFYKIRYFSNKKILLDAILSHRLFNGRVGHIEVYREDEKKTIKEFLDGKRDFAKIDELESWRKLPVSVRETALNRLTSTFYFLLVPRNHTSKRDFSRLCSVFDSELVSKVYGPLAQKISALAPSRIFLPPLRGQFNPCFKENKSDAARIAKGPTYVRIADIMSGAESLVNLVNSQSDITKVKAEIVPFTPFFDEFLSGDIKTPMVAGFVPAYMDLESILLQWFDPIFSNSLFGTDDYHSREVTSYITGNREEKLVAVKNLLIRSELRNHYIPFAEENFTFLVSERFRDIRIPAWGEYFMDVESIEL